MSLGHPQVTHITGVHVTRKGRVYYYRRRLPQPLAGEVGLSLRTANFREAEWLACCIDAKLPDLLRPPVTSRDLGPVLRAYLDELRQDYAERHRSTPPGRSMFYVPVTDHADPIDVDLDFIDEHVAEHREAIGRRNWGRVREVVTDLMKAHEIPEDRRAELAEGVLAADIAALAETRERLLGRVPPTAAHDTQRAQPDTSVAPAAMPAGPRGPRMSEVEDGFLAAMQRKKVKPWPDDEVRKARSVYKMFREWCEDKPLNEYRRSDVYNFYEALAQLPRNHGKSPADRERTMLERIEAAADQDGKRLTAKTMEGYATRLIAIFDYGHDVDDPSWTNPAEGFGKFAELGEASMSRAMWEGDPLTTLLAAPVWTGCSTEERPRTPGPNIIANERFWLPVLALYSGARLEELARLVRGEVLEDAGIPYLSITDDEPVGPDGELVARKARVKTKAGVRRVPLHPAVLSLGFLDYVRHIAPQPADFLFPRLKADPKKGNQRSGKFSQWFTAYRRDVGVNDPRYVFHSFRHGVATKLLSSSGATIGNIVALIGHEHDIAKAMQAETLIGNYLRADQIPLRDLADTINRVAFPEANIGRPTVFSDGTPFPPP